MPLSALNFYIISKYKHEVIKDSYFANLLRHMVGLWMDKSNDLPIYWDVKYGKQDSIIRRSSHSLNHHTNHVNFKECDIRDMLRGKGHLVQK